MQLGYTTIKAPLGGQVGLRLVDEGNIVHAADQAGIVTIAQLEPIAVVFSATETQLPAIRKAMTSGVPKVRALSTDGSRVLAEGTLKVIDNQVDTATGTIRLKAEFDNADHALWPGLSVTTELVVGMLAGAIVAPEGAVQLGPNGPFAYVVDSAAKAEMRELVVGSSRSGKAVIEKGLAAGEQVITSGQYKVQPNGTVAVLQPRSDPQAPATRPGADK